MRRRSYVDVVSRRPWVLYAALAGGDAFLAATGRTGVRRLTKPLLMPVLMVGSDRTTRRALALGGIGDTALLGRSETAFRIGLGSFLLGHAAWVVTLRGRARGRLQRQPLLAVPYLVAWVGLNAYLWGRTGRDRLPVLVYSAALLATSLAALDTGDPLTAAGGALFLTSDTLLALERFGGVHLPAHEGIVMVTDAGAQALLAGRYAGGPPSQPRLRKK
jgi:uncharacterized membrane protein YhhN